MYHFLIKYFYKNNKSKLCFRKCITVLNDFFIDIEGVHTLNTMQIYLCNFHVLNLYNI